MRIDDIMDCEGCKSYRFIPGRTHGDPCSCFPGEAVCKEGAPDNGPCQRMLNTISDWVHDGHFSTASGQMFTSGALCDEEYGKEIMEAFGIPEDAYDFASSVYWWLPFDYGSREDAEVIPYENEREIYNQFFT